MWLQHHAWLSAGWRDKGEDKPMQSRAERMGIDVGSAEMPETIGGEWLIDDLFALGPVASDGMGIRGVTWGEIESWSRLTRTPLEIWEAEALSRLSSVYASAYSASQEPDHKGYWIGDEVAEAQIEKIERADESIGMIFGALAQRSNPRPSDGA